MLPRGAPNDDNRATFYQHHTEVLRIDFHHSYPVHVSGGLWFS